MELVMRVSLREYRPDPIFLARLMDDLLSLWDVIVADLLTIFLFSPLTLVEVDLSLSVEVSAMFVVVLNLNKFSSASVASINIGFDH
jgi:hypothetical protein